MPERSAFDYAVLRIVPNVERGEFLNVGLILHCPEKAFLRAQVHVDEALVRALCPTLDCEQAVRHLETFPKICAGDADAGPISQLPKRQRFHWLVSPRSTIVQISPVHCGICESPEPVFEELFRRLVLR